MSRMVVAVVALFCVLTSPAQAYLDPGTGSMLIQATIGIIVGALFTIKVYWQKVRNFMGRLFKGSSQNTDSKPE